MKMKSRRAITGRCNVKVSHVIAREKPKKDVASWANECNESVHASDAAVEVREFTRACPVGCVREYQNAWVQNLFLVLKAALDNKTRVDTQSWQKFRCLACSSIDSDSPDQLQKFSNFRVVDAWKIRIKRRCSNIICIFINIISHMVIKFLVKNMLFS